MMHVPKKHSRPKLVLLYFRLTGVGTSGRIFHALLKSAVKKTDSNSVPQTSADMRQINENFFFLTKYLALIKVQGMTGFLYR